MHLVIPVTIATAMAADVMRQRCFSGTERPEETDCRFMRNLKLSCNAEQNLFGSSSVLS